MEIVMIIVLGGIVLYVGIRFLSQRKKAPKAVETDLQIQNVRPGGVFHLMNIGPEMEEYDVTVLGRHLYKEGGFSWHELEGDNGSQKVWLEIEQDDELFITITLQKLKLRDLGISKSDLERFDDQEQGTFTFDGKKYHYDDSGKAVFYRNSDTSKGEKFYYWDFEADDEKYYIGVERWNEGSYEVSLSQVVKPSQITVFSLS